MAISRRQLFVVGTSALLCSSIKITEAKASKGDEEISKLTGGAPVTVGGVKLTTPEIAENGNRVSIEVSAPGAEMITLIAMGNPQPRVVSFEFGTLAGSSSGTTRIRLMKTQEVIAIAKMKDGSFKKASNTVKVTIGGCGG